jgi:hypothetical protein
MKQTLTSLTVATAVSLAVAGTAVAQDDSGFSISGWINEGFAYYDDGNQSDVAQVSDNGTTLGSRITFAGFAELPNTGAKAGFEVIIEPQSLFTPLIFSNQDNFSDQNGGALGLLGSSAYIEGSAGKLTVGLQSMPTDNIAVLADPSLTLWSSISPLFRFNGFEIQGITDGGTAPVWGDFAECLTGDELQGAGGIGIDCNGIYRNGVRYDLPTFAEGLNIAAGYANSEIYDVAVKYNRDFGALTGIVHLGFAQNSGGTQYYRSANMFAFQGGLKHNDSGVYGTVAVQTEQANDLTGRRRGLRLRRQHHRMVGQGRRQAHDLGSGRNPLRSLVRPVQRPVRQHQRDRHLRHGHGVDPQSLRRVDRPVLRQQADHVPGV